MRPGPTLCGQLDRAGISWKAYFEEIDSNGKPGAITPEYNPHYNPFVYYESVRGTPSDRARIVGFDNLYGDLKGGGLMRLDHFEPLSIPFVLHLHRLLFQHAGGRGGYLKRDENFIVSNESGHREVVFRPPPPEETEFLLRETIDRYNAAKRDQVGHPLLLVGALILDVLAIHPVADGNGRLARLLTTYELLSQGYGVARYVSVEQRVYDSRNTYYQRLYESQQGWHTAQHTIWPWVTYLATILAGAYDDFEQRVADAGETVGSKQDRVRRHILEQAPAEFRRRDIERAMPGVSPATIRLVLNELRDSGKITVEVGGPGARWRRQ